MRRKLYSFLLVIILIFSVMTTPGSAVFADNTNSAPQIKNVIYMIPDGGGFALFDFANAVKEAGGFTEKSYVNATKIIPGPMHLKDYLIGTVTTYSANSNVTDSAAAGTALATGHKTNNKTIGLDSEANPVASLLEAAQLAGKKVGICATVSWVDATPAAFTAHNTSRNNKAILGDQIINQKLDVVLGVGFGYADAEEEKKIKEVQKLGYTVLNTKKQLGAVKQGAKIWGNFDSEEMPNDISLEAHQPTLADMTRAAIHALEGTEEGFFLMVEGSKIDFGGHNNNLVQAVSEYMAFDEAFKVALDYAKNRTDTIVIVVPDHDTGGLVLLPNFDDVFGNPNSEDYAEAVSYVQAGINIEDISKGVIWQTDGHTNRRVGVWLYAPEGINPPEGLATTPGDNPTNRNLIIDNTEIAPYVAMLMGVDLQEATEKLFVNVLDLGTYDFNTEIFTFTNVDVKIAANQSVATVNGRTVDLDGQIAIYVQMPFAEEGTFYVPQLLLSIIQDDMN